MHSNDLKLTFHGGAGYVTGANFLLEESDPNGVRLLVDCGLIQGTEDAWERNSEEFGYDPQAIDYLFVTHGHLDHVGRIPKLVKDGFKGTIYSTPATRELATLILFDSERILRESAKEHGNTPLYDRHHVEQALSLWKDIPYHTKTNVGPYEVFFKDAGHILGSSIIEFTYKGKKIVFTGDLGNSPAPLLRDTEDVVDADYMIMESVYGDRNHEGVQDRDERLRDIIKKGIERGGAVLIPAFSIERTQNLLHELNHMVEEGEIPAVPTYLDSPLAIKVTDIYKAKKKNFNQDIKGEMQMDDIFNFPNLTFTLNREESMKINDVPNPKIIIAGSGMSNGGRIVHHHKRYLSDPNSTVLLVGYQAVGTRGRALLEGAKKVTIDEKEIEVNAHVENITGYSAHKDSDNLIKFVENTKDTVSIVFVAMGEPKASLFLAQRLKDYLDVNAVYPEAGKTYLLEV